MSDQKPDVDIVIRTRIAAIPMDDEGDSRFPLSRCLVVPCTDGPFVCATDTRCLAVVGVEGEAERESTVDLTPLQSGRVRLPAVVKKTGRKIDVVQARDWLGELEPVGEAATIEDDSVAAKYPNTAFALVPVEDPSAYQVIRVNADLLCMLAEAITQPGQLPHVSLIVPRHGGVDDIRVVSSTDIGVVRCLDYTLEPTDAEIIEQFNRTANAFNAARAAAKAKREGGAL